MFGAHEMRLVSGATCGNAELRSQFTGSGLQIRGSAISRADAVGLGDSQPNAFPPAAVRRFLTLHAHRPADPLQRLKETLVGSHLVPIPKNVALGVMGPMVDPPDGSSGDRLSSHPPKLSR